MARDVSSALAYLHSRRIVYRDLKQDNVGFNVEGEAVLFDFGLARWLPPPPPNEDLVGPPPSTADDVCYRMSGRTGSLPFMSPEVYHRRPYNAKADVFSMSVLLWVVVALELPYLDLARDLPELTNRVMNEGHRPPVKEKKWPGQLVRLLKRGWSPDPTVRPTMNELRDSIEAIMKSESVPSVEARAIKRSFFR